MGKTIAQKYVKLRVFIEGIEFPVSSVTVTFAPNMPAQAQIITPAIKYAAAYSFAHAFVQIFYQDEECQQDEGYLLFEGYITGDIAVDEFSNMTLFKAADKALLLAETDLWSATPAVLARNAGQAGMVALVKDGKQGGTGGGEKFMVFYGAMMASAIQELLYHKLLFGDLQAGGASEPPRRAGMLTNEDLEKIQSDILKRNVDSLAERIETFAFETFNGNSGDARTFVLNILTSVAGAESAFRANAVGEDVNVKVKNKEISESALGLYQVLPSTLIDYVYKVYSGNSPKEIFNTEKIKSYIEENKTALEYLAVKKKIESSSTDDMIKKLYESITELPYNMLKTAFKSPPTDIAYSLQGKQVTNSDIIVSYNNLSALVVLLIASEKLLRKNQRTKKYEVTNNGLKNFLSAYTGVKNPTELKDGYLLNFANFGAYELLQKKGLVSILYSKTGQTYVTDIFNFLDKFFGNYYQFIEFQTRRFRNPAYTGRVIYSSNKSIEAKDLPFNLTGAFTSGSIIVDPVHFRNYEGYIVSCAFYLFGYSNNQEAQVGFLKQLFLSPVPMWQVYSLFLELFNLQYIPTPRHPIIISKTVFSLPPIFNVITTQDYGPEYNLLIPLNRPTRLVLIPDLNFIGTSIPTFSYYAPNDSMSIFRGKHSLRHLDVKTASDLAKERQIQDQNSKSINLETLNQALILSNLEKHYGINVGNITVPVAYSLNMIMGKEVKISEQQKYDKSDALLGFAKIQSRLANKFLLQQRAMHSMTNLILPFKPSLIVGLPILIERPDGIYIGLLNNVTHIIDASGAAHTQIDIGWLMGIETFLSTRPDFFSKGNEDENIELLGREFIDENIWNLWLKIGEVLFDMRHVKWIDKNITLQALLDETREKNRDIEDVFCKVNLTYELEGANFAKPDENAESQHKKAISYIKNLIDLHHYSSIKPIKLKLPDEKLILDSVSSSKTEFEVYLREKIIEIHKTKNSIKKARGG